MEGMQNEGNKAKQQEKWSREELFQERWVISNPVMFILSLTCISGYKNKKEQVPTWLLCCEGVQAYQLLPVLQLFNSGCHLVCFLLHATDELTLLFHTGLWALQCTQTSYYIHKTCFIKLYKDSRVHRCAKGLAPYWCTRFCHKYLLHRFSIIVSRQNYRFGFPSITFPGR